ncbi:hypothetical protein V3C99_013672 [Haemonchus contortus]|uniref:Uncharacterized protein n=1 Tax=Haemonchus contortus TaxID=6289 RepID=A0A7I4Y016_HAECO
MACHGIDFSTDKNGPTRAEAPGGPSASEMVYDERSPMLDLETLVHSRPDVPITAIDLVCLVLAAPSLPKGYARKSNFPLTKMANQDVCPSWAKPPQVCDSQELVLASADLDNARSNDVRPTMLLCIAGHL